MEFNCYEVSIVCLSSIYIYILVVYIPQISNTGCDGYSTYLNIVWTATIVLQSAKESSSAEFESSLFTTTTFSASVIPALSKSSRLQHKDKPG